MAQAPNIKENLQTVVEIGIRIGFLVLLIAWCLRILHPFTSVIVWGLILALAIAPIHRFLNVKLGNRVKLSSSIIVFVGLLLVILPAWLFMDSIVMGIKALSTHLEDGTLVVPPPGTEVSEWPVIGESLYQGWSQAATNLESFIIKYEDQIKDYTHTIISGLKSITGGIFMIILSIITAGVLLAARGAEDVGRKFFKRLVGERGDEFTQLITSTVQSVVKGVIGVALIQALLVGLGCFWANVPYPGLWAIAALVMAILQLPVTLLSLLIIIWLFSNLGTGPATLWTIFFIIAGISDNILKPVLLGRGASVPTLVIFLGVIGGFISSGFIGLFTGAIVISIGYKLFITWLNQDVNQVIPGDTSDF
jgi:predicted PurR-regulated permease PerM